MKVILVKNIQKIGDKDEIKEVANGYARNFLLPRGLAMAATAGAIKRLEEKKERERVLAEQELSLVQEAAAKLEGLELEIPVRVDGDGNLYAGVGPQQIIKALNDKNFDVKKSRIKLENQIKELGEKEVVLEFPHGLEAKIRVIIVAEQ